MNANVLIVDDDPLICELLTDMLHGIECKSFIANSGDDAIKCANVTDLALVISDVNMPGETNGIHVLSAIKSLHPTSEVILMTGRPEVEVAVDALKIGALDYLSKPLDIGKLQASVKSVITRFKEKHDTGTWGQKTLEIGNSENNIAGYRIIRTIGEGGMGTVYLAEGEINGKLKEVALKVISIGGEARRRKIAIKRFLHEAKAISRVEHPNIVKIYDYGIGENNDVPYIALEYVPCRTLKQLIRERTPLTYKEKTHILYQAAAGIGAIHDSGIYHRDVKPDNLLIMNDLTVKITDFGIASLPESNLTLTSNILGSPAYLSPEGFLSAKMDYRSDFFSLGSVAYEFYLGKRPFTGDTFAKVARQVRGDLPTEPKKIDSEFPMVLQLILAKLLKKNPDDRYQTANDLLLEFNMFLDDEKRRRGSRLRDIANRVLYSDWS